MHENFIWNNFCHTLYVMIFNNGVDSA